MKDEKILEDEMLDEEQLDNVVGGTCVETREMSIAYNQARYGIDFSALDVNNPEHMRFAQKDLQEEFERYKDIGLTAEFNVGVAGTGIGEKANKYYYNGVEVPHDVMVNIIKKINI